MSIQIVVAQAQGPREVCEIALELAEGSTVGDAIHAACLLASAAELKVTTVGVWGRPAPLTQPLRDLDRVETYRPLKIDNVSSPSLCRSPWYERGRRVPL